MLLLHFKLPAPEPFEADDLVRDSASGLQPGRRWDSALSSVSRAVGSALRRDLCSQLVLPLGEGKFDTLQLVTRVTVLADFVLLLRSAEASKIDHFFDQLIAALAEEQELPRMSLLFWLLPKLLRLLSWPQEGYEPPSSHVAALFDAFFLLHGLTSENEAVEMRALAVAYERYKLPVSQQTSEEVRWLHENYYGRKDKGSVRCRLPHFNTVCERIASIRALDLQKVSFQRHLEKTKFVGELFGRWARERRM